MSEASGCMQRLRGSAAAAQGGKTCRGLTRGGSPAAMPLVRPPQARRALAFALLLAACVSGALIPEPEVKVEVLSKPFICQRKTKLGDMLLMHYSGFLDKDGTMFHSSHKQNNGQPIWFTLGIKETIQGWDRGLQNMCAGEKRKLTIPPVYAYGKKGKVTDNI
uniref:peptidylprolyl isomerase n=1 Tax=Callorhinchus milii TaxID=7868 RepID=A0A4W3JE30_CALMI